MPTRPNLPEFEEHMGHIEGKFEQIGTVCTPLQPSYYRFADHYWGCVIPPEADLRRIFSTTSETVRLTRRSPASLAKIIIRKLILWGPPLRDTSLPDDLKMLSNACHSHRCCRSGMSTGDHDCRFLRLSAKRVCGTERCSSVAI